jgi:hypothetical protein
LILKEKDFEIQEKLFSEKLLNCLENFVKKSKLAKMRNAMNLFYYEVG